MSFDLFGKTVLLFSPKFFGYETEVLKSIQRKCGSCVLYDERAEPSILDKICIRLNYKTFLMRKIASYYRNIIAKYAEDYFDYVVFLNPETITVKLLEELRARQKRAHFVLYMWDSLENKPHTEELLPCFDTKLSFNKKDCEAYGLKFRPLFFIDEYDSDKNGKDSYDCNIDIGFIGTIHSDRYRILRDVGLWAKAQGLNIGYYMYFPAKILYYKYKLKNLGKCKVSKKDFHFSPLNSKQVQEYLGRCKTIIDIQHPKQIGLTMRTIEMLGMRKKLITTNADIKNYDFYNEDNICVIDRNHVMMDKEFLSSDYNRITDVYRKNYTVDAFVDDLLDL